MRLLSVKDFRLLSQKTVTADDEIIGRVIELVSDRIEQFLRGPEGQLTYGQFEELQAPTARNHLYVKSPPIDVTKDVTLIVNAVTYDEAQFKVEAKTGRITLLYGSWLSGSVPNLLGSPGNEDVPFVEVNYSGGYKPQSVGVARVTVGNAGSGYVNAPVVTLTDPSGQGSGAVAVADISNAGVVSKVTVTVPGSEYTTPPDVLLSGGGGSGATALAVLISPPLAVQALRVPEVLQRACFLQAHYEYLTRFGTMTEVMADGKPTMLLDPNLMRTELGVGFLPEVEAILATFRGRVFV